MKFINIIFDLFIDMSLYLVLGLIMVGFLNVFVNRKWLKNQVGDKSVKSVVKSSLIGVPLPLCSCGVVPTAIELKKSGASHGAVVSFLISTPQTGVDNIVATWGFIGPFMAFFRAVAAFISGIIGGIITNLFKFEDIEKEHQCCKCHKEEVDEIKLSLKEKFVSAIRYGFIDFLDEISVHFIIGLLLSAIITLILPDELFVNTILSNEFLSMLLMILIGLPMYICSTASLPIALSLMMKGLSPGAAFVFLFAGPVTNVASVTILISKLGKKLVSIYLLLVMVLSLLFGFVFNFIVNYFNIDLLSDHGLHEHSSNNLSLFVAGFFLVLVITSLYRVFRRRVIDEKKM